MLHFLVGKIFKFAATTINTIAININMSHTNITITHKFEFIKIFYKLLMNLCYTDKQLAKKNEKPFTDRM